MPRLLAALAQLVLSVSHCPALLSLDVGASVALERTELPRVSVGRCGVKRIQDHVVGSVSCQPCAPCGGMCGSKSFSLLVMALRVTSV